MPQCCTPTHEIDIQRPPQSSNESLNLNLEAVVAVITATAITIGSADVDLNYFLTLYLVSLDTIPKPFNC